MESLESHGDMLDRKTGAIATCQIQSAIESVFSWTLVTQMYFGKYIHMRKCEKYGVVHKTTDKQKDQNQLLDSTIHIHIYMCTNDKVD